MPRLLRLSIILASCVLLAEAAPGCADTELNPQPLPPGKEDQGGDRGNGDPGSPPPSAGGPADASSELNVDAGDAGDGGDG